MPFINSYHVKIKYLNSHLDKKRLMPYDSVFIGYDCPVCSAKMIPFTVCTNKQNESILEKSICELCQYIHFTRRPSDDWIANYYESEWDSHRRKKKIPIKYSPGSDSYKKNLFLLNKFVNKEDKIFDLGCGYGTFLSACQFHGFSNLFGMDASEYRVQHCQKIGFNVHRDFGETFNKNKYIKKYAPFDVIHSHHALEHVVDINEVLANCNKMLKMKGILILRVPNIEHENYINITKAFIHIRNFTKQSLTKLLINKGFVIKYIDDDLSVVAEKNENNEKNYIVEDVDLITKLENKLLSELFPDSIDMFENGSKHAICSQANSTKNHDENINLAYKNSKNVQIVSQINFRDRIIWNLKKIIIGRGFIEKKFYGNKISLFIYPRSLLAKILRKILPFNKSWEMWGDASIKIMDNDGNSSKRQPLFTFNYNSDYVITLMK